MKHKIFNKKFIILGLAVLIVLSSLYVFLFACTDSSPQSPTAPKESKSICLVPPQDGSSPEDYGGLENVGYIIGRLLSRDIYHTESNSTAIAAAVITVEQNVVGSKDYKDGVLITSTVSTSASSLAPSKAIQRFYGEDKAVVRSAASDKPSDWAGLNTQWSTGDPSEILDKAQHEERYGLWATEFSDYVINEETCLSFSELSQDENGYSLTVDLEPNASTYYYKNQMKTMGNLDGYPSFSSVQMTFHFTADWTITKLEVEESYTSKKAIFTASCEGYNVVEFFYDEASVDVSDYESYFARYADAETSGPTEKDPTAADYFAKGFASLLSGETRMNAQVQVAGETLSAAVLLDMRGGSLNRLQIGLGSLQILYEEGAVYLNYKDFLGKISVRDITALLPAGEGFSLPDMGSLQNAIAEGRLNKEGENVTIACDIPLGDSALPIEFGFTETDGAVSWTYIDTAISAFGLEISAHIAPDEGAGALPAIATENAADLLPFIENITELFANENYTVTVGYRGADVSVACELTVGAANGLAVRGRADIVCKGIALPAEFTLWEDTLYLRLNDYKIKAKTADIAEVLRSLSESGNFAQLPQIDAQAADILAVLIGLDYDAVVKTLTADGGGISLVIDADALLSELGQAMGEPFAALGDVSLRYEAEDNRFCAELLGASVSLAGGGDPVGKPSDAAEYVGLDLARVADYLRETVSGMLDGSTQFRFSAKINGETLQGTALLKMRGSAFCSLQLKLGGCEILLQNDVLYAKYKDFFGKISLGELAGAGLSLSDSFDLAGLLEAVLHGSLTQSGEFVTLSVNIPFGGQSVTAELVFSVAAGGVSFETLRADFALFGQDIRAELGFADGASFSEFDTDEAIDLKPFIDGIRALAENRKYFLNIDYEGNGFAVSGDLTVNAESALGVRGALHITFGKVGIPVEFTLVGGDVYLKVEKIMLRTTVAELESALREAFGAAALTGSEANDVRLSQIVSALVALDYDAVVKTLALDAGGLKLVVDGDALLSGLASVIGNANIALGDVAARYSLADNGFVLEAFGARINLAASEEKVEAPADKNEYVPLDRVLQFIEPAKELAAADGIAFTFDGAAAAEGIEFTFAVSGEAWFADGLRAYLDIQINDDAQIRIYYADGTVRFAYNGYGMEIDEREISLVADKFSSLFAANRGEIDDTLAASLLLFSADGFDLEAILGALRLAAGEENALILSADLAKIFGGGFNGSCDFTLSVNGKGISLAASGISYGDMRLHNFALNVRAAESETVPDFAGVKMCPNVFEFILNAYTEIAETQFMRVSVSYADEGVEAVAEGAIQFEQSADGTAVTLNLDFTAQIKTFAAATDGTRAESGAHYLHLIILRDRLYLSYSLYALDADTALRLQMPVSELFAAGETILPILAPILGIGEDTYYYNFVNAILGGYYETIHSGIFGEMSTAEWCDLIVGIVGEYAFGGAEGIAAGASSASVGFDAENFCLTVEADGLALTVGALQNAAAIAEPADAAEYIDGSTLARLLQDLLRAYAYADTGYTLVGTVGMDVIGIELDLTVNIEARIGVENGNVFLHIRLTTPQYYNFLGTFMGDGVIVNGNTVTDIAIRDGYVYMTRTQTTYYYTGWDFWNIGFRNLTTPYVDCRAMTLSSFFGEEVMNHIFFAINLSSGMQSFIQTQIDKNTSDGGTPADYDAGQMVTGYTADDEGYYLALNLGAVTGKQEIGEMTLNILRAQSGDGYDLTKLYGSLKLVSVISMNYDIAHSAPGSEAGAAAACAETIASVQNRFGYAELGAMQSAIGAAQGYLSYTNR